MTQNMGPIDRAARVVVAFAVAVALLSLSLGFGTVMGIVLLVVAGILLITATVGFCPLYALFHISARSRRHASL
jgi:fatty acid desaturase